jgi:hypothetical protein
MESFIGVLTAGAGGGILGLLGSAAGRALSIWETKEKRKDMIIQNEHEIKLIGEQAKVRAQETEDELKMVDAKLVADVNTMYTRGSVDGLVASIQADSELTGISQWVSNVRALVRPSLTLILWVLAGIVWFGSKDKTVLDAIVMSASMATAWWFGDRVRQPIARG